MDSQSVPQIVSRGDDLVRSAINILETLDNLTYLIKLDVRDAALVAAYASEVEERLRALRDLLRCIYEPDQGPALA